MSEPYDAETARPAGAHSGRACVWAVIALIGMAAGAFGYWRFVYYPTTPQYALGEFLSAARYADYPMAYSRLHVTAPLKLVVPSAEALQKLAQNAGGLIPRLRAFRLGVVQRNQETATVRTTLFSETGAGGQVESDATEVTVEMRQVDGRWKVDGAWVLRELIRRGGSDLLRSLFQ